MATVAPPTLEHFGQPMTVSIYGVAVDDFGVGLPRISVSVLSDQSTLATTNTDEKGEFSFPNLAVKVGFHSLRAAGREFIPAAEQFTLTYEMDNTSITTIVRLEQARRTAADEARHQTAMKLEEKERTEQEARLRQVIEIASSQPGQPIPSNKEELASYLKILGLPAGQLDQLLAAADRLGELQKIQAQKSPSEASESTQSTTSPHDAKYIRLQVLFATDRNRQLDSDPRRMFGSARSSRESTYFGVCEVSVPNRHRIGKLERPSIFKLQFYEDPEKHIILQKSELWEGDFFYNRVSTGATTSPNHDVFVFIHGYCVTFQEAILRTAQIAVDLDFSGVPICFSWPSRGTYSGYFSDEATIEWSTPHLVEVVRKIAQLSGVRTIHLIAHSMGNRALVHCLDHLAQGFGNTSTAQINQVILAAPDIDAGVMVQLGERVTRVGKRTTLYASSNDRPLVISRQFHGYARAGDIGDAIYINENIDTVDASAIPVDIFGHSYYGSSRTVLHDIYELFRNGTPPPRFGLQKASQRNKLYWIFRP